MVVPEGKAGVLAAELEARVDEGLVDRHHVQRADDLVARSRPRALFARNPRQAEQRTDVIAAVGVAVLAAARARAGPEVVPAERHDVAEAQPKLLVRGRATEVDERTTGCRVTDRSMLVPVHATPS